MAKIQTRMEKYKDYREEIKQEVVQEPEVTEQDVAQFLQANVKKEKPPVEEVVTKHTLDIGEKEEKVKAPKNIYDEYLRKKRLKYFLYSLFVITIVGGAIAILVLYVGNFIG